MLRLVPLFRNLLDGGLARVYYSTVAGYLGLVLR